MLENMRTNDDPIRSLENSPFKFYLTGSRYFGGADTKSDWDFFVDNKTDVEEFLIAEKFINISVKETAYFGTDGIVKLYRKGRVDVHLVTNAERKNDIQKKLREKGIINETTDKGRRKLIWKCTLLMEV